MLTWTGLWRLPGCGVDPVVLTERNVTVSGAELRDVVRESVHYSKHWTYLIVRRLQKEFGRIENNKKRIGKDTFPNIAWKQPRLLKREPREAYITPGSRSRMRGEGSSAELSAKARHAVIVSAERRPLLGYTEICWFLIARCRAETAYSVSGVDGVYIHNCA